jgi:hypothetical protein
MKSRIWLRVFVLCTLLLPAAAGMEATGMTPAVQEPVGGAVRAPALAPAQDLNPSTARLCNGLPYLCEKRFGEVTFPGNHNSGSNRVMDLYCGGTPYPDTCYYRNQGKTITEQLAFGIRYFDIDTCVCFNQLVTCHRNFKGSPISALLDQFDAFLNLPENRNEVIVLTFGDQQDGGDPEGLQRLLRDQLLRWEPTPERIANRELMIYKPLPEDPPDVSPTLGELVASNRRIVLFVRNPIAQLLEIGAISERDAIFDTWRDDMYCTWDLVTCHCDPMVDNVEEKCDVAPTNKLVLISAFCSLPWSICLPRHAECCQGWLLYSLNVCRNALGGVRVPTFIAADWTQNIDFHQNIVQAVRYFNQNLLKENEDNTLHVSNGTASYIGFESRKNGRMISTGVDFDTQWFGDEELWKWVPDEPSDRLEYGQTICLQSKTTGNYLSALNDDLVEMPHCLDNEKWTIERFSDDDDDPYGTVGQVQAGDAICLRSELAKNGWLYVRAYDDALHLYYHCLGDEKWFLQAGWDDSDEDLVIDEGDNCPATPNPDQADRDNDGIGDACDPYPYGVFLPTILRRCHPRCHPDAWDPVAGGGPFSDAQGWGAPQYYATIHSGDIDGDGADELLGRGVEGMSTYRFTGNAWEPVPVVYGPFTDAEGWGAPQYYATIHSADIDGDGADELLGRGEMGMSTYRFTANTWEGVPVDYGPFTDAEGWGAPQYYATIHSGDIDGDGVDELLARGDAGMQAWRFSVSPGD